MKGLAHGDAARRRERLGANRIETYEPVRWPRLVLRQVADVLILILIVAAIVSALVGEMTDAITILVIVVLNGALGFLHEWKAERSLTALRRMLAPQCPVIRDGALHQIDAADLVPGDLVPLDAGDRVPADLRVLEAHDLRADESSLTGESLPVEKRGDPVATDAPLAERRGMAWTGTLITGGRGRGVVVATGGGTELGRIAALTRAVEDETTPLQRRLAGLGRALGVIALLAAALVALAGWLAGRPPIDMLLTGISLAVAAVPEGLPAVVTITLALGLRTMARQRALLRRLQAAETLGSATVICTDKTGTLTRSELMVSRIWLAGGMVGVTGSGFDPTGVFETDGTALDPQDRPDLLAALDTAVRCTHARIEPHEAGWRAVGDSTEAALVVAARKAGLDPDSADACEIEFPFDSERKRMTVVTRGPEGAVAFVKGAPEIILERVCRVRDGADARELAEGERARISAAALRMAEEGLRVLAIARRELPADAALAAEPVERDLELLAIVGMLDAPRREVPEAIRLARSAHIRPIMITGDAAPTAAAVARRVGLEVDRVLKGPELAAMSDVELRAALRENVVFARTTPEHKLRIVSLLQADGHVVAMTGDGVNDGPALKQADVGIAMGVRGTDVARGAADMVLTDDNFATIVSAVREGRRQLANISKFVHYLLSSNTGEVLAIFVNILLGGPLILLPAQILWINLVTDGLTAASLGLEPAEPDVMQRPPRAPTEPIVSRRGILLILALGGYVAAVTLGLFHLTLARGPGATALAQTMAFTAIIVVEKMNVLNFRASRAPLVRIGLLSNPWVVGAIALNLAMQACVVYVPVLQRAFHTVPLAATDWLLIAAAASPILLVPETVKWFLARRAARA